MTPSSTQRPPPLPSVHVARGEAWLAEALNRRLTVVVAGAGFGKSTLLGEWARSVPSAWYTVGGADAQATHLATGLARAFAVPDDLAASLAAAGDREADPVALATGLAEALETFVDEILLLVDDLHELSRSSSAIRMIEALVRLGPPNVHFVLASRLDVPFPIERLRGRGQVLAIGALDLRFSLDDVQRLAEATPGQITPELAAEVQALTDGWPAAVRLALEALKSLPDDQRSRVLARLRRPGGLLYDYLANEVLAGEAASVRRLLMMVSPLDFFTAELCERLGLARARETISGLATRGLFVQEQGGEQFELHALVREVAQNLADPKDVRRTLQTAADWFVEQGRLEDALGSIERLADPESLREFVAEHGFSLVDQGSAGAVLRAACTLTVDMRTAQILQVMGSAHAVRGELDRAFECFERAAAAGGASSTLAWQVQSAHGMRGQWHAQQDLVARPQADIKTVDDARFLADSAWNLSLRGDTAGARPLALGALEAALRLGEPVSEARARQVLGMVDEQDGDLEAAEAHYRASLEAAVRARRPMDVGQARLRLGKLLTEEGRYDEALAELEIGLRVTELSGLAINVAWGSCLRGDVYLATGRLEEALTDYEVGKTIYQEIGTFFEAWALNGIGNVQRERGDLALARVAYEHALGSAERSGTVIDLVPALAGLARVLAREEPTTADDLAKRALAASIGERRCVALLAAGWVALSRDDRATASGHARAAATEASRRQDRAALAESLELHALSGTDTGDARARLEEAAAIWTELGNPLGEGRARLVLTQFVGRSSIRSKRERAERRLRAMGVRPDAASRAAGVLAALPGQTLASISIQTLGGYRVLRDGREVPAEAWRGSQKARELLKILVARRGRPTSREFVMETLWPEQEPEQLGNRLSVALTTVRSALDPERDHAVDHFVAADAASMSLNLGHVDVDVERFLDLAEDGLQLRRSRGTGAAEVAVVLREAEEAYPGDFLEEDRYQEWAVPLREEALAAYLQVARLLAEIVLAGNDLDMGMRYLLRMLERDAYDEGVHLALVATLARAGRHGEARRRFAAYLGRMAEIGVEPAPFPIAGTAIGFTTV